MNILFTLFSAIVISAVSPSTGYNIDGLAKALGPAYPIGKINEKVVREEGAFQLLFNINNPGKIEIPHFEKVLNGQSHTLLSCYGKIIPRAKNGYVVGTALEGPTFGKLIVYDNNFQKITEIVSQKVVKINLENLLGGETRDIVTWEDHHYGTNTTRRVLNIYRVDASKTIKRIFAHDLIDATGMPGNTDKIIDYKIDYHTQIKQNKIIVINEDTGFKEIFTWDGARYKGEECRHIAPTDAKHLHH